MITIEQFNSLTVEQRKAYKQCNRCLKIKSRQYDFYKNKGNPDGKRCDCIDCHKNLVKYGEL